VEHHRSAVVGSLSLASLAGTTLKVCNFLHLDSTGLGDSVRTLSPAVVSRISTQTQFKEMFSKLTSRRFYGSH
jgi:hypothetical protein